MTFNIAALQRQVQHNCHVSDANFSGAFSLCGLLLRLRDLYKWETGLPPWEEPEQHALMAWIEEREGLWLKLEGQECRALEIHGKTIPIFEAWEVNDLIAAHGLLYGAGCAIGMKPSFFLARPAHSTQLDGLWVHTVERELARDIFTTPVMRQGNQIVARRHAMATTLWDMALEQRASVVPALNFALSGYGLDLKTLLRNPKASSPGFLRMVHAELEVLVHHEIGEAREDAFPDDLWHQMIEIHKQTLVEVFLRSVKDLLADTHPQGLVRHVITEKKKYSLGLYAAMMRPLTKLLFPEADLAFPGILGSLDAGGWRKMDRIRDKGYRRGRELALRLTDLHLANKALDPRQTQQRITEEIIRPLGILGLDEDKRPSAG